VSQIKELGGDPKFIQVFEEKTKRLKASLKSTLIETSMPRIYTEQSLQDALRERLTEDELKMVVNPIASNVEMKHWAEQLTEGTTSDLDKAKALFGALAGRLQAGGGCGHRTAEEVCAAWNDTDVSFICTEYANLFVALAGAVGLKAFYVHVEKDYRDKTVHHDCAVVFVDDEALLVDAAYRWFGVPHKEFVILDDLQTIAHHLVQLNDPGRKVALRRLAVKLHPDFAWVQFALIKSLCEAEQWDEAHAIFESVLQLDPQDSEVYFWRGIFAINKGDLDAAINCLQKALELNPEDVLGHFNLGNLLGRQGKLNEAREEFRACLRYDPEPDIAEQAHRIIAQINEQIGVEHNETETNEHGNNRVEEDN
jgi:tetratricopeptide (TPR) repeat protein